MGMCNDVFKAWFINTTMSEQMGKPEMLIFWSLLLEKILLQSLYLRSNIKLLFCLNSSLTATNSNRGQIKTE